MQSDREDSETIEKMLTVAVADGLIPGIELSEEVGSGKEISVNTANSGLLFYEYDASSKSSTSRTTPS